MNDIAEVFDNGKCQNSISSGILTTIRIWILNLLNICKAQDKHQETASEMQHSEAIASVILA